MTALAPQNVRQAVAIFLDGRLNERAAFEWAATLAVNQEAEREAVRLVLQHPRKLVEPYGTAWSWLLESWNTNPTLDPHSKHGLKLQLKRFGAKGHVLDYLLDQVRPWLNVEVRSEWELALINEGKAKKTAPRKPQHLARFTVESGSVIRLSDAGFDIDTPPELLIETFERVEGALLNGLHLGHRIGEIRSKSDGLANHVASVRFLAPPDAQHQVTSTEDADIYKTGFAPSVKLLDELIQTLKSRNVDYVERKLSAWRVSEWGIFRRLWAASAADPALASPDMVADFLRSVTDDEFWRIHSWREIGLLRAKRFSELPVADQHEIIKRIRRGPPKAFFWDKPRADELTKRKHYAAARELHRLHLAGAILIPEDMEWFGQITGSLPDWEPLESMDSDVSGRHLPRLFRGFEAPEFVAQKETLLEDLNKTLEDRNTAGSAATYIKDNLEDVLACLLKVDVTSKHASILNQLAIYLSPNPDRDAAQLRPLIPQYIAVLNGSENEALAHAIGNISDWMPDWANEFKDDADYIKLWHRLWPIAVAETNSGRATKDDEKQRDQLASDALNTSVGRLISAMEKLMPDLTEIPRPFETEPLASMRAATIKVTGRARLQVLHRYLQHLEYLRNADGDWADKELLYPLIHSIGDEVEIWDAVSRHYILRYETMKMVGEKMAEQIRNPDVLSEETRARLAERLVYRILVDKLESNEPSVSDAVVQQTLRKSSDRIRAAAAWAVHILLEAKNVSKKPYSPEEKFDRAVESFFREVWPLELTLRSKALSDKLAQLPAQTGARFAAMVAAIERLLTPFDCWSLWEYRLLRDDSEEIRIPAGPENALALLTLLDLTIGMEERSVCPYDIGKALEWIRAHGGRQITSDRRYARLEAMSRIRR